ncbi:May24p [Kluyveromyces lactis]|uniref:KLLA0E03895p n=1 Tax=Kluyveromyces lactis (strain ATCC 8585 / CBS 2359 / DSM 70799 / NBRC 1267 / NRRL Y-1140 / WM37) TaxID=284590 RepID=B4UNA1_KLULA|nr:uncharacterized protein KLLA0_E03895g [Kluyveromyces lactis]CAR56731.1 KLLA0E03895p [Kluyveromyces lactis]|eukprot:XP_002999393.1 uncharacterized protein KLLA0_E03895g [Kluyveromyces lactis]
MKTFFITGDVPVGYQVPDFPSLYWPMNNGKFSVAYLYYLPDIWRFTIFWTMILFAIVYGTTGAIAWTTHKKILFGFWMIPLYIMIGMAQAFVSGTVVGILIAIIYKAGLFAMSTWIPLCCAVVQILFNVSTSYSMTSPII